MAVVVFPVDAVSSTPTYVGEDVRQALGVLAGFAPSGRPLGAISGVRPGTPTTTVTVSGSGPYTWNCAPFAAILDVASSATAGPYLFVNDSTISSQSINANPSSGNQRNDIVYAVINDPAESVGSGGPSWSVSYVAGTAAASGTQSDPTVPTNGLALARLTASSSGAPTVTWIAPTFTQEPLAYSQRTNTTGSGIANTTTTTIGSWDVEAQKNFTYSAGTWTIVYPGVYDFLGQVTFPANGTGNRSLVLQKNGTTVSQAWTPGSASVPATVQVQWSGVCAVGDTLTIQGYQSSGGTLGPATNAGYNRVSVTRRSSA